MQNCLKERVIFRQRKTSIERFNSLTSRAVADVDQTPEVAAFRCVRDRDVE